MQPPAVQSCNIVFICPCRLRTAHGQNHALAALLGTILLIVEIAVTPPLRALSQKSIPDKVHFLIV